jgi:hypothetical protein
MVAFLLRRYLLTALALTLLLVALPVAYEGHFWETLPWGLLVAAPVAAIITYRELNRQNVWILVGNLGNRRLPLLLVGGLALMVVAILTIVVS